MVASISKPEVGTAFLSRQATSALVLRQSANHKSVETAVEVELLKCFALFNSLIVVQRNNSN